MGLCEDDPSCDKIRMRLFLYLVPRHVGDIAASWALQPEGYVMSEETIRRDKMKLIESPINEVHGSQLFKTPH